MANPIISTNPDIMLGKPVISGTRITVESILRKLAAGEGMDQILDSYPRLTKASIHAALEFAADSMGAEVVIPHPRQSA